MKYEFFFAPYSRGTMPLLRLATFTGYPHELENITLPYGNVARESVRLRQCADIILATPNVLNVRCLIGARGLGGHEFVHRKLCDYFSLEQPIPSMDMNLVLHQSKEAIDEQLEK
jgi:hypothetical protein